MDVGFPAIAHERAGSARIQARQSGSGRRITLQTVLFDGMLQITDVELLRSVVSKGLGHGKAWGLGLLSLARMT